MMSTDIKKSITLDPKEFYLWKEANQATRARWVSYYDVTIPCVFIH